MGVMDMMGEGFAGTTKGSFFEAPSWVNKEMAAGRTNQVCVAPTSPFFFHEHFHLRDCTMHCCHPRCSRQGSSDRSSCRSLFTCVDLTKTLPPPLYYCCYLSSMHNIYFFPRKGCSLRRLDEGAERVLHGCILFLQSKPCVVRNCSVGLLPLSL